MKFTDKKECLRLFPKRVIRVLGWPRKRCMPTFTIDDVKPLETDLEEYKFELPSSKKSSTLE